MFRRLQSPIQQISQDRAVTTRGKTKFDSICNTRDKTNQGYINGDEVVPFSNESKLPEEALAQIWDLADINSTGCLSREDFAVAVYLIRQQRSVNTQRERLPSSLPINIIPPSMRK
jgi:epidermal growth factor receptor substrate 15